MSEAPHREVDEVVDVLGRNLADIGFKAASNFRFVRRQPEVTNTFLLQLRTAAEQGANVTYLTPVVQTDFPKVKKITTAIRGSSRLPFIGGALGRFTPKRSLIEWKLDSGTSARSVATDLWGAVESWALPFWERTRTASATFERFESGEFDTRPPYWEDLAAIRAIILGTEAAVQFVLALPDTEATGSSKDHAVCVLRAMAERSEH